MSRLFGWFFRFLLLGLSLLPFSLLYFFSDRITWLIYEKLGYRRKVVRANLEGCFPEKTSEELSKIENKYYHSLVDIIFECIKLFSLSDRQIRERFIIENSSLLQELHAEGRSVFLLGSHQFNWEWANHALTLSTPHQLIGVYLPLNNQIIDEMFYKLRSSRGQLLMGASQFKKDFPQYQSQNPAQKTISVLMGDQNPGDPGKAFWVSFLGQESPFHGGLERIARRQPVAVVLGEAIKTKRGYYRSQLHLICKDSTQTQPGEITYQYAKLLEASIRRQPENWVWSHRRWRHTRSENAPLLGPRVSLNSKMESLTPKMES